VVGESGSGKSTLARLLLALENPDAGEVVLDGAPWSALAERRRRPLRRRIQLIDQDPFGALDPRWTVRRILREAVALSRGGAGQSDTATHDILAGLLDRVGLPKALLTRRPHELSGGQRQRVAIARALARRPEVLVCDEPVSALDVSVQAQVLQLLESLQREGLSMVFISHDLAVIGQVSDEILVMRDGRAVEQGGAAEILARPAHPFTRELLQAGNLY
jgi:peptide/nickel transport system ATP-binding protein